MERSAGVEPVAGGQPVDGVELGVAVADLKLGGQLDLALLRLAEGARTAAVFTRNAFCAAPVIIARRHLADAEPRVLLVNSGCANAGTGAAGREEAEATCARAGSACGVDASAVLPFSTGLIGQRLSQRTSTEALEAAIGNAAEGSAPGRWHEAARAIMTTDTQPKLASRRVSLAGGVVTVTGMAKGSGMIRPDMATMLGFVATDAVVDSNTVDGILREAVDASFHCITVDGDTSTNDAVTLSATGSAGVAPADGGERDRLAAGVTEVCLELAQSIVRDAEGASRFVEIDVGGGADAAECRTVAFTVAHSPLVKTALFGGDPNWGRILAAVGRAPIDGLDVANVDIHLGDLPVVVQGEPVPAFDEARAAAIVGEPQVRIGIGLGRGDARARVWTSDLSYDYVRINADYTT